MNKKKYNISLTFSIIAFIIFFIGGCILNGNASSMKRLRSQSGDSLAEVYYQDVGYISQGLGWLSYGIGFSQLAIIIGMGAKISSEANIRKQTENLYNKDVEKDYEKLNQ